MSLPALLDLLGEDPALLAAVRELDAPELDLVGPRGMRAPAIARICQETVGVVLAVTATGREAEDLVAALGSLLPADTVAEYPAWETLPHERLSPRADTVGRRLAVLRRLAHPGAAGLPPLKVVVTPVRAVLQPQVAGLGDVEPIVVAVGDTVDLDDLVARLVHAAYHRVDLVERRGQIAVRGGILDVFPPTEEHPLRIDLFGDEVEEIREFSVADQRSLGQAKRALFAPPCRELLLTDAVRARAKALAAEYPTLVDVLDAIAEGTPIEGMEALAPVLADALALLVDELPAGSRVIACDPEKVRLRSHDLVQTSQEFLEASWANAASGNANVPIDLGAAAYRSLGEVREHAIASGVPWWGITPFTTDEELSGLAVLGETRTLSARAPQAYRGDLEQAFDDVHDWTTAGWRVLLVTEGHGPADRLMESLAQADIGARCAYDLLEVPPAAIAVVATGCLEAGFVSDLLKLVVLTESDLAGQRGVSTKDMRRLPSRRRNMVDPLQLAVGDYVVHEHHGIGRYLEMVKRTVNGGEREYLIIEYAKGDRVYVPTDALELVTRYVGGDSPTLHKLGGSDWAKAKGRAKKAVKEIAAELIRLYSARMASPGHAYAPDTPWQRELEDAFPYAETPDQLEAINEVKRDMESPLPMDRLICGDVGYGKTEIAVRAAFKAVQDGRQVAVLVPTTLLVQQHLSTFAERFSGFPVKVAAVSRFNSEAEQKAIMAGVADGTVDVVIGTHRLLAKDADFKNLGLLIVDEEQRFGVEHKEFLKHMRTAVDVLTMSATPIPRTLEMAITGIREMSTIQTPPEERHPVLTFVGPQDPKQITAAIRRELLREGQVFYIHNRVESIDRTAAQLRALVPEARVEVAHGQMHEDALERIMVGFWERAYDVLVCTTIVESGLDVSNANTLIVERADVFGLSQLHQLRGRVGRGRERAYSYFLYPPDKPLTELAHDRLATIAANTDLGSGMAVAMKDLEIRGAGNLLGGEQSGHIANVGFDLYVRLVGDAVSDFKRLAAGLDEEVSNEVKVELPVDAHLPHDYIPGERLRLQAYKALAAATDQAAIDAVREELVDRYGEPPLPVENLLAVASFRAHARPYGISEVSLQGNMVRFAPVDLPESRQLRLQRLYKGAMVKPQVRTILVPKPTTSRSMGAPAMRDTELLKWCRDLLDAVLGDTLA